MSINKSKLISDNNDTDVCYLSPSFFPATKYGGPIFSTLFTCRELIRKGLNISIHTTNVDRDSRLPVSTDEPVRLPELDNHPVHYHKESITDKFSLSFVLALPKAIKNSTIVHSQSVFSICSPLAILLSKFYKKKVVISPRGSLGPWCINQGSKFKRFWLNIFYRPFLPSIYWHVTAEQEKQDVLSVFRSVSDDKFLIVPNGIDNVKRRLLSLRELSEIHGLLLPEKYIVSSGRVDDKKGFDYTISALNFLPSDIHLVIMGEDYGSKDKLVKLANDYGLNNRVHFIGHQNEDTKWSIYHNAFVFSLNSRHENFGNVYIEALSVGTPIISSIYTPWDFINQTGAGFCIDNDPQEIANCISLILNSDANVEEYCLNVCSNFYWENIASTFISEYKRISNVN